MENASWSKGWWRVITDSHSSTVLKIYEGCGRCYFWYQVWLFSLQIFVKEDFIWFFHDNLSWEVPQLSGPPGPRGPGELLYLKCKKSRSKF